MISERHSTLPVGLQQPWWVLATASSDHPPQPGWAIEPEAAQTWERLRRIHDMVEYGDGDQALTLMRRLRRREPNNLWLFRYLLAVQPEVLTKEKPPKLKRARRGIKTAVLVTGALRCLDQTARWINELSRHTDCFICTTAVDREKASVHLADGRNVEIQAIEDNPAWSVEDQALPINSMRQWLKLHVGLEMIQAREQLTGQNYTHLIKLRSDYLHCNPHALLLEIGNLNDRLGMASDKVFGGPRALMLQLQGFYRSIAMHGPTGQTAWPICVEQILRSDDAGKWMGFGFPADLVGHPSSVNDLRSRLQQGGPELANALGRPQKGGIRFFEGDQRFASEVAFARFLNLAGIPWVSLPSLQGQLLVNRHDS